MCLVEIVIIATSNLAVGCLIQRCYRKPGVILTKIHDIIPDSKVHGANMRPIWGRQDPGGPHVDPMNFAICVYMAPLGHDKLNFQEHKVYEYIDPK